MTELKRLLRPRAPRGAYGLAMQRLMLRHYGPALPEIERILGRPSPDSELRGALAEMLWQYIHDTATAGRERPKEVNRWLEGIDGAARSLRDKLNALVYASDDDDHSASAALFMIGSDAAMELLNQLDEFTLATWQRLESRGGPTADYDLHVLLRRVLSIYEFSTGKTASATTDPTATEDTDAADVRDMYSGQLMEMAALVERVAATVTKRSPMSNSALGQKLKEIGRAMKRWPEEQAEREREAQRKQNEIMKAVKAEKQQKLEAARKFAEEKRRRTEG
jgi:hypothetical protein